MHLKQAILYLFCILIFGNLQAQDNTFSVQDALNIAIQKNPEINRLKEQSRILESQYGLSWGIDNPEFIYLREGLDGSLFTEQRWGVSQSFIFPLTGYYQNQKARADVSAIEMELESFHRILRGMVKKAYAELAYAIKFIELTEREVELAEELRKIAQIRLEVGESTKLDLIQSEIRLVQAQNELRLAEVKKQSARFALFRTIGLDTGDQFHDTVYPDTLTYFDIYIDKDVLLSYVDESPEVKSVKMAAESARQGIKVSKSSYLPQLRVDYYKQDFGGGYDFTGFEVGVSIPLWFGLNERNHVMRSNAFYRQAEWGVTQIELQVKERAENAWHSYESSRETILSYRDFVQLRSENLLALTSEGYQLGELDFLRVLEAQRTYLEGQQLYYQALRNYYIRLIELELYWPDEFVFN